MPTALASSKKRFSIGIMLALVESTDEAGFTKMVERSIQELNLALTEELGIDTSLFSFAGPHLTPSSGSYAAMDFLRIGMNEKIERDIDFLLIVTEVDLSASKLAYALALPSQLTNIAVISTKRLDPAFWGQETTIESPPRRLTALMLHSFGHLLNLPHHPTPTNVMYDFKAVEELDAMVDFTEQQRDTVIRNLPVEARERVNNRTSGRLTFILRAIAINLRGVANAVIQANPFRLLTRLPTMITAALSVLIFLLFTPDMWDVASVVELYQIVIFAVLAIGGATLTLYRSFASGPVLGRDRVLSESAVVTETVIVASLLLTMTLLFCLFACLIYVAILAIFPQKLMQTWTTVVPATGVFQHVKLCIFVAGLSLLAGSLGGRADSQELIRGVLFTDEET